VREDIQKIENFIYIRKLLSNLFPKKKSKKTKKKRRAVDWREPPGAGVVDGK
jgi:hypothetical protein